MRPIAISLSPNTEADDVALALKLIFSPGVWEKGEAQEKLVSWFEEHYGGIAVPFNSGRSAQMEILAAAGIGEGDEVLVQALTCVAVPNSVIWTGSKPVFVDIDKSFNMDPTDAEAKVTDKTRALIVQHTFGIPAQIEKLKALSKKYKLLLIEDCAHSLGATLSGKAVGTFGDAAFFSFGRDKVISSVFGGMAVIKNGKLKIKIEKLYRGLYYPSRFWILQQVLHPVIFNYLILPTYNSGLGKILLFLAQQLNLLSRAVYKEEYRCARPNIFPGKLPNALTELAFNQLKKLERFNEHRKNIANLYFKELSGLPQIQLPPNIPGSIWLRFPILSSRKRELLSFAKQHGILLGDWYDVVTPKDALRFAGYKVGSCPNAEDASGAIVNLPTYPTLSIEDAQKVVSTIGGSRSAGQLI